MKIRIIILSIVAIVAMFAIPSITAGAATSAAALPPTTTNIDFSPTRVGGTCDNFTPSTTDYDLAKMAEWDNLTDFTRTDTNTKFTVKFKLLKNLCNPFTARATVYDLPAGATSDFLPTAWPQTRYSSFAFDVYESGTYIVTFNKSCPAQQFDVHTGAAPQTLDSINSTTYHGPLLFGSPALDVLSGTTNSSAAIWYGSQSCQGPAVPATTGANVPPTNTNLDFNPTRVGGECVNFAPRLDYNFLEANTPQWDNLTDYTRTETSTGFVVKFSLKSNLCNPFTARATVYDLPAGANSGNVFSNWPQTRYSTLAFQIQESGIYTITFNKTCVAQQFDVHTGSAPQRLESLNDPNYHGPLLFGNPFMDAIGINTDPSALIWYGSNCNQTTTSTTSSTTTSSTTTTSTSTTALTTVPPTVLGTVVTRDPSCNVSTTTSTQPTTTTTTEPEVDEVLFDRQGRQMRRNVKSAVVCNPSDTIVPPVQVGGINVQGSLPVTGSTTFMVVSIAGVLLTSGVIFFISTRRRIAIK